MRSMSEQTETANGEPIEIVFQRHTYHHRCEERGIEHDDIRKAIVAGIPVLVTAWRKRKIRGTQQPVVLTRRNDKLNIVGNFETDGKNHTFAVLTAIRKPNFEANGTPVFQVPVEGVKTQ